MTIVNNYIKLSELTNRIKSAIDSEFKSRSILVLAEINGLKLHSASGHWYLDLIETDNNKVTTKINANIWKSSYAAISRKLISAGLNIANGMKTVFTVSVNYNVLYGLSLNIVDMDVVYIKGELQIKKEEIKKQLIEEGIYLNNKNTSLPQLIKTIALITAKKSAGIADFYNTLKSINDKCAFNVHTYSTYVQGVNAKEDITKALRIIKSRSYDIIVILRGGGSELDLNAFNDFDIAKEICTSPIPVICGIGHATDNTICDDVAFHSADNPTRAGMFILSLAERTILDLSNLVSLIKKEVDTVLAAKQNLINQEYYKITKSSTRLVEVGEKITKQKFIVLRNANRVLQKYNKTIDTISNKVKSVSKKMFEYDLTVTSLLTLIQTKSSQIVQIKKLNLHQSTTTTQKAIAKKTKELRSDINVLEDNIKSNSAEIVNNYKQEIPSLTSQIKKISQNRILKLHDNVVQLERVINLQNPDTLLKKGYSISLINGKTIKAFKDLRNNDSLKTIISSGTIESTITKLEENKNE